MSDGKCSSYQVVSQAELARRALDAAQVRAERVARAVEEFNLAQADTLHSLGVTSLATIAQPNSRAGDASHANAQCDRAEAALAAGRAELGEAIAAARAARLTDGARLLLTDFEVDRSDRSRVEPAASAREMPRSPDRRAVSPQPQAARADALAQAHAIFARLPGEAQPASVAACLGLIAELEEGTSPERAQVITIALRDETIRERRRLDTLAAARAVVERFVAELDGCIGKEADALRASLLSGWETGEMPDDAETQVVRLQARARREADRAYVLATTTAILQDLGYEVGEETVTLVVDGTGALIPARTSRDHGIRLREQDGQLFLNVVAFGRDTNAGRSREVAERFCTDYVELVRRSAVLGVEHRSIAHFDPGSGRVERIKSPSPFAAGEPERTVVAAQAERRVR